MEEQLDRIECALGIAFRDRGRLREALTHPSYSAERQRPTPDNQRLEFLGDAVLQLIMTDLLYDRFPDLDEGGLTKLRSALTKESALASYARHIGLGPALRLGRGEEQTGGRERPSNLADAFEAVLGAVYQDQGLPAARTICEQHASSRLESSEALLSRENPKGALQEWTQLHHQVTPDYDVVTVTGPEHEPEFTVRVLLHGNVVATGSGRSRKTAEKRAAAEALARLKERAEDADETGTSVADVPASQDGAGTPPRRLS